MVAGLPFFAKTMTRSTACKVNFFSSDDAPEVILQKSFAEELLGKTAETGGDQTSIADLAKPLVGKELVMRYAQRVASPTGEEEKMQTRGEAYSVLSRQQGH